MATRGFFAHARYPLARSPAPRGAGVLFTTVGTFMLTADPDNPGESAAAQADGSGGAGVGGGGAMGIGDVCGLVREHCDDLRSAARPWAVETAELNEVIMRGSYKRFEFCCFSAPPPPCAQRRGARWLSPCT